MRTRHITRAGFGFASPMCSARGGVTGNWVISGCFGETCARRCFHPTSSAGQGTGARHRVVLCQSTSATGSFLVFPCTALRNPSKATRVWTHCGSSEGRRGVVIAPRSRGMVYATATRARSGLRAHFGGQACAARSARKAGKQVTIRAAVSGLAGGGNRFGRPDRLMGFRAGYLGTGSGLVRAGFFGAGISSPKSVSIQVPASRWMGVLAQRHAVGSHIG